MAFQHLTWTPFSAFLHYWKLIVYSIQYIDEMIMWMSSSLASEMAERLREIAVSEAAASISMSSQKAKLARAWSALRPKRKVPQKFHGLWNEGPGVLSIQLSNPHPGLRL